MRKVKEPHIKTKNYPAIKEAVRKVSELRRKANIDAIEILEDALKDVKSGEIESIAISWVNKDGAIGGDRSSTNNKIILWASLEHHARSYYQEIVEDENE